MKKITDEITADYRLSKDGLGLTIEAMFDGIEGLVQSKTVMGEPVTIGEATLIPINEVSAGMASGAFGKNPEKSGAGAMTTKMSPVAVLVLQGDRIRLINIKNQDAITKIIDLIPDAIDRITGNRLSPETVAKAKDIASKLGVEIKEEPGE
ncbi:MAG: GerW family sporulation protein [Lachnospiraceae bacterium]|nr:GerW family sporulation protein [Lachnospiraceae bacterium]